MRCLYCYLIHKLREFQAITCYAAEPVSVMYRAFMQTLTCACDNLVFIRTGCQIVSGTGYALCISFCLPGCLYCYLIRGYTITRPTDLPMPLQILVLSTY